MRPLHSLVTFCGILSLTLLGCGAASDGPPLHAVSGTVTFAGEPIAEGEIRFIAADGKRIDAGKIETGLYRAQTSSGKKRVEVYAVRKDPNKLIPSAVEPGKHEPATEMYIPTKFNEKSELTADIADGGKKGLDFSLAK